MKILIAADGSKFTSHAVNYLIDHVGQFGDAEVTLMNIHVAIPGRAAAHLSRETVRSYYDDECNKALNPARRALKKAGIAFKDAWSATPRKKSRHWPPRASSTWW
jgi:nucleotide-binding universal stress UspA family protein